MRTAAVVIDNFLSEDRWIYIQNKLSEIGYLNAESFVEEKNNLHSVILEWISQKLKELDIWNEHWEHTIPMWSYINTLPPGINREESGGNDGYHKEFGGLVYYMHPTWQSEWGGHLKFKNCDVDKIVPVPNRFVWINPSVWHGIEVVNETSENNRITFVSWPEGCVEYPDATLKINILTEG